MLKVAVVPGNIKAMRRAAEMAASSSHLLHTTFESGPLATIVDTGHIIGSNGSRGVSVHGAGVYFHDGRVADSTYKPSGAKSIIAIPKSESIPYKRVGTDKYRYAKTDTQSVAIPPRSTIILPEGVRRSSISNKSEFGKNLIKNRLRTLDSYAYDHGFAKNNRELAVRADPEGYGNMARVNRRDLNDYEVENSDRKYVNDFISKNK